MSQPNSSSSAQDLLDALNDLSQLVKKRGLGISGVFRDSGRFSAFMRDLHPGLNKEIVIISVLINEGLLMRLHSADAEKRAEISGLIKVYLDNFGLKAEDAQTYSDVLLAFCNGETILSCAGSRVPSQPATPSKHASPQPGVPSLRNIYANKRVGECFDFGRYPQGTNGEIEPITWRVLQREAGHLLVIAEQGLDFKPYNEKFCEITWETCTLRRWLNSGFYDQAFNEQEHNCILKTRIDNNAGPKTEDYIFLLSVDEAKNLFANDSVRCAKPTEYAYNKTSLIWRSMCSIFNDRNDFWWLRSRGRSDDHAACVGADGSVDDRDYIVNDDGNVIRPALNLAL